MKWISVETDLPEHNQIVLVADVYSGFISLAKMIDEDEDYSFQLMYIENIEIDSEPTHWMPLPNLPEASCPNG